MEEALQILVVDDEPEIRNLLCILLKNSGFVPIPAENGVAAVQCIKEHPDTDLIIMDIMMPKMSGTEACYEIRKISKAPVLFLTAKTREIDKSEAYLVGGDDFLPKPFSQAELLMKVNSLTRRYRVYKGKGDESYNSMITLGGLVLDLSARKIKRGDQSVDLTEKEYDILLYFYKNRGHVVDAVSLYENVWEDKYMDSSANTIMVHIVRLRKKLEEDPSNPQLIRTVYGKGYILE